MAKKNNKNGNHGQIGYDKFIDMLMSGFFFSDDSDYLDGESFGEDYDDDLYDEYDREFDSDDESDDDDEEINYYGNSRSEVSSDGRASSASSQNRQSHMTWWERMMADREEEEKRREEERQRKQKEKEERERKKQERERKKQEAWNKHVEEVTDMSVVPAHKNPFASDRRAVGMHADSADEGLILSLSNIGEVDIEFIAEITGYSYSEVIVSLRGKIYQNPEKWDECYYKGWEDADEYLTGCLYPKLVAAKSANEKYKGYFNSNVEALESVMPEKVPAEDIYVTLGSPWVPTDVINQFMYYLFDKRFKVRRDSYTGAWEFASYRIPWDARYFETYGTDRIDAIEIIDKTLNMKTPSVYDNLYSDLYGKYIRVFNREETIGALDKQKLIVSEFQRWIWENKERRERLEQIYWQKYGSIRKRTYNGDLLPFPGMSKDVSLYKYQKDAVARIIYTKNTLLAHEVGAGKTYIMVAAGMELLRMGLSKKNMYVVPNNILSQWENIFKTIYPFADLLMVYPKDFTPTKRESTLRRIRDEKHDAIIIPYSSFGLIPVSKEFRLARIQDELDKIANIPASAATSRLRRRQSALFKKRNKIEDEGEHDGICFDELGVTRLFIDEAHNYKNLAIDTNIDGVMGISATGSAKCTDMLDKVRIVQFQNDGLGGVVLATGTPLTNSVTEAFIMQTYLQPEELEKVDLQNFDSWAGMFGEKVTEFEIDVDTSGYRLATRFSKFHNLPELTSFMAEFADFHSPETSEGVPIVDGYTDVLVPKTAEFDKFLQSISARADAVRARVVDKHDDNMLLITTDGRKAALDLRLCVKDAPCRKESKVVACATNVFDIYLKYQFMNGTQLVFCDTSTPKESFNLYDELRNILIDMGVPKERISFIHDAQSDSVRFSLFEKVRSGEVRILIGSTFKMGLGMNVQDRLVAIHHIDIPWRPADMVQREGRILRPGNMNEKVYIYRYITEGSFDAYSWQILESKQKFISEILSGAYGQRSSADIKDAVLNYAEVKALAIGNPLIKERVEKANDLAMLMTLRRKYEEGRANLRQQLSELPEEIALAKKRIEDCQTDIKTYRNAVKDYEGLDEWKALRRQRAEERKAAKKKARETSDQTATGKEADVAVNGSGLSDVSLPSLQSEISTGADVITDINSGIDVHTETFADTAPNELDDVVKKSDAVYAENVASVIASDDQIGRTVQNADSDRPYFSDENLHTSNMPSEESSIISADAIAEELIARTDELIAEEEGMEALDFEEDEGLTEEEKAVNKKFLALDNRRVAERRDMRELLVTKIFEENFHYVESVVGTYHGFEILIPSGMSNTKPYVWVKGAGKYSVELGSKSMGYMVRIDNFLDDLSGNLKKYRDRYNEKTATYESIQNELKKEVDYDSRIQIVKEELDDIDKRLGLDENADV